MDGLPRLERADADFDAMPPSNGGNPPIWFEPEHVDPAGSDGAGGLAGAAANIEGCRWIILDDHVDDGARIVGTVLVIRLGVVAEHLRSGHVNHRFDRNGPRLPAAEHRGTPLAPGIREGRLDAAPIGVSPSAREALRWSAVGCPDGVEATLAVESLELVEAVVVEVVVRAEHEVTDRVRRLHLARSGDRLDAGRDVDGDTGDVTVAAQFDHPAVEAGGS